MNRFAPIDSILAEWAKKNEIYVQTEHKDGQVRSVEIVDPLGVQWQLWVEPNEPGGWRISWWNRQKDSLVEKNSTKENLLGGLQAVTDKLRNGTE